jgi:hypothetical protein
MAHGRGALRAPQQLRQLGKFAASRRASSCEPRGTRCLAAVIEGGGLADDGSVVLTDTATPLKLSPHSPYTADGTPYPTTADAIRPTATRSQ